MLEALARLKTECGVLVLHGVKVAEREEWARLQRDRSVQLADEFPRDEDRRLSMHDKDFLLDREVIREPPRPARPRLVREAFQSRHPIGMHNVRRVALRGNRKGATRCFDPGIEAIHERHASGGRGGRRQEQRVVAPCADAGDGAAGEAAEAVGFQPFGVERCEGSGHEIRQVWVVRCGEGG